MIKAYKVHYYIFYLSIYRVATLGDIAPKGNKMKNA